MGTPRYEALVRTRLRIAWLALSTVVSGCAYRFTNAHVQRPEGIRTIAIEAVYDTSREVLPHELFWEALQAAFAADGKLRLASQERADAYLRIHLKDAALVPAGSIVKNPPEQDPKLKGRVKPPEPTLFKPLGQAGEIKTFGQVRAEVEIEVWSLRTRSLLLRRTYDLTQQFRAVHGFGRDAVTTRSNDYLRYEESFDAKVKLMAQDLAGQVVRDLLVR
jgi:hypothetical protein